MKDNYFSKNLGRFQPFMTLIFIGHVTPSLASTAVQFDTYNYSGLCYRSVSLLLHFKSSVTAVIVFG